MKRRNFLTGASLATAASMSGVAAAQSSSKTKDGKREFYELRKYHMGPGDKKKLMSAYLRDGLVPALNRQGIDRVGVFNSTFGSESLVTQVLIPHKSLDSVVSMQSKLDKDKEYTEAVGDFLKAPLSDPAYVRMESSLMAAFTNMPVLKASGSGTRIFEMRVYESHSKDANTRKVEMFNDGGEIDVFLESGFRPVFFGETIIGPRMPNLTYMLEHKDLEERAASWSVFSKSPGWQALRKDEYYAGTVSNISVEILKPASYSQI